MMHILNTYKRQILLLAIVWFVLAELLPSITMPEINRAEAAWGNAALKIIHNRPADFSFLGRHLPISVDGKHSALEAYILVPFVLWGGPRLEALRAGAIFIGMIIIVLTYYFGSKLFNPAVGILSVVLLVINPSFLDIVKLGAGFGFTLPIFTLGSLLLLFEWHNKRKNLYLYLGMTFLGLGYYAKGWFIWFVIALGITAVILYLPRNKVRIKTIIISAACLFLVWLPILCWYVKKRFFVNFVASNFIITVHKINNLNIFYNLYIRLAHLSGLLIGASKEGLFIKLLPLLFFLICVAWLLLFVFLKKKTSFPRNKILFILVLFCLTLILSSFNFTIHRKEHLFILFPYIQVIMAIGIFEMFNFLGRAIKIRVLFLLFVTILFASYFLQRIETCSALREQKEDMRDCNIPLVTEWLLENKIPGLVTFGLVPRLGVEFYSNLKIHGRHLFKRNRNFLDLLKWTISNADLNDIFVFNLDQADDKEGLQDFLRFSKELNKEVVVRKEFLRSNGDLRFTLYSLK